MRDKSGVIFSQKGTLFTQRAGLDPAATVWSSRRRALDVLPERPPLNQLAFLSLLLFTSLLYLRPNDLLPQVFGSFPFAKIAMGLAILTWLGSRFTRGEKLMTWSTEVKMVLLIGLVAILTLPFATWRAESVNVLIEQYAKIICVFVLLVNLVDSEFRLNTILQLMVVCGAILTPGAIYRFLIGDLELKGERIAGYVGVLEDPNDYAMSLNILLPLALVFALKYTGWRRIMFAGSIVLLIAGVIVTFSRGGFLGLIVAGVVVSWKLRHQYKKLIMTIACTGMLCFLLALPTSYGERLYTIIRPNEDVTTSAQERQKVLQLALNVAARNIVFGVGMGNFRLHSFQDKKAHNSYVEILAELGLAGLLAYLTLLLSPLRSLWRIEKNLLTGRNPASQWTEENRDLLLLSIALQASILAYMVCSFFLSVQYLWHIYYPIAAAVALRQFWKARESDNVNTSGLIKREQDAAINKGALWRPYQLPHSK